MWVYTSTFKNNIGYGHSLQEYVAILNAFAPNHKIRFYLLKAS